MSAHTPGPWEVITGVKCVGEPEACVLTGRDAVAVYADDPSTARANAHLIAAAPKLLEVLQKAHEHLEATLRGNRPPHNSLKLAVEMRAAIAKAEGKP